MFTKNLKEEMLKKGICASDLSKMTGISKSLISQYMSGKAKPPVKKIKMIAEALQVETDALIRETKPMILESGEKRIYNLKPENAAKLLGVGPDFIKNGLKEGTFPWGYAVKQSTIWTYFINSVKFFEEERIEYQIMK